MKSKRAVPYLALAAVALAGAATAQEQEQDPFRGLEVLSEDAVVGAALQRNTSLAAAEAAFEATSATPAMAGALMDPMVTLEAAPLSFFAPEVPLGVRVEVAQRFPFPGKRGLKRDAAEADARAAKLDAGEVRLRLREAAQGLFASWYQVHRALDINAAHQRLVKELKRAAEAQYAAGMMGQQDALQAELMLAELEMEAVELTARQKMVGAQLNGLVHRAPAAALPPPPKVLEPSLEVPEAAPLQERATNRPMLGAMDARIDAAGKKVAWAQRAWLPDFELMAGFDNMQMDDEHRFMVGVGIEIPLQQGMRRGQLQEAEAMARKMRAERDRATYEVATEVEEARQALDEAVGMLAVQRDRVLPAARAALDSARAGYISGRTQFQALIEAERSLRTADLRLHVALADVVRRRASLERMIGEAR